MEYKLYLTHNNPDTIKWPVFNGYSFKDYFKIWRVDDGMFPIFYYESIIHGNIKDTPFEEMYKLMGFIHPRWGNIEDRQPHKKDKWEMLDHFQKAIVVYEPEMRMEYKISKI